MNFIREGNSDMKQKHKRDLCSPHPVSCPAE